MAFPVVAAEAAEAPAIVEGGEVAASGTTKFGPNAATTGAAGSITSRLQRKEKTPDDKKPAKSTSDLLKRGTKLRGLKKAVNSLPSVLPSKLPTIEDGKLTKINPKDAQKTIVVGLVAIVALHLGLSGKLTNLIKLAQ